MVQAEFVCLFVLRLNVPVNNFSVMSGRMANTADLDQTINMDLNAS